MDREVTLECGEDGAMLCMRTAPSNEESPRFCDAVMAESDAADEIGRPVLTRDRAGPGVGVVELC